MPLRGRAILTHSLTVRFYTLSPPPGGVCNLCAVLQQNQSTGHSAGAVVVVAAHPADLFETLYGLLQGGRRHPGYQGQRAHSDAHTHPGRYPLAVLAACQDQGDEHVPVGLAPRPGPARLFEGGGVAVQQLQSLRVGLRARISLLPAPRSHNGDVASLSRRERGSTAGGVDPLQLVGQFRRLHTAGSELAGDASQGDVAPALRYLRAASEVRPLPDQLAALLGAFAVGAVRLSQSLQQPLRGITGATRLENV